LLQTLSFKPICLTAKYGWVLAASENGELAYFSVADDMYAKSIKYDHF